MLHTVPTDSRPFFMGFGFRVYGIWRSNWKLPPPCIASPILLHLVWINTGYKVCMRLQTSHPNHAQWAYTWVRSASILWIGDFLSHLVSPMPGNIRSYRNSGQRKICPSTLNPASTESRSSESQECPVPDFRSYIGLCWASYGGYIRGP